MLLEAESVRRDTPTAAWPSPFGALWRDLVLLALWLCAFIAARWLEYAPHASLWFPPAAVTLASFAVFGWRAAPAMLSACAAATLLTDQAYELNLSWPVRLASAAAFALSHCMAYGAAAAWIRRSTLGDGRSLPRTMAVFLLGGAGATLLAAFGGVAGLSLTGMIPVDEAGALIVPWMIGDYAALVALAPLLVVSLGRLGRRLGVECAHRRFDFAVLPSRERGTRSFHAKLAALLGLTLLVFAAAALLPDQPAVVFTIFFAVVIQMWIVHTEGARQALASMAIFSVALAGFTALFDMGDHAFTLQFAMITVAANTCFGLGVPQLYADNARLRQLLIHDTLTGAFSRAYFIDLARLGIRRAQRRGQSAAMLMIDLDHLKTINDQYGHAVGDRALTTLVRCCRDMLRPGDLLGRLSGDEFGVFLPEADRDLARQIAERLRRAVAAASHELGLAELTASFGVSELEGPGDSYEELLMRADQALYASKRGGRDRVAIR